MRIPLLLVFTVALGCPKLPSSRTVTPEEDPSISFPKFFEQPARQVGEPGALHELDGVTLRALMIAANDFLPERPRKGLCWEDPAAYRYRVIREADVVFIRIDMDPTACEQGRLLLDSGVQYAIHVDGRILRRLSDGEPETVSGSPSFDAGDSSDAGAPGATPPVGSTWGEPSPFIPPHWLDGGTSTDAGSQMP